MNYFYELPLELQKYIYILRAKQIIQDSYFNQINKIIIASKLINEIVINPKYWITKTWIDNWNIKHNIKFINLINKHVYAVINYSSKSINNYCDKLWWNNKIHYFVRAYNYFKIDKKCLIDLFKLNFNYKQQKYINDQIITFLQNYEEKINKIEKFINLQID